MPEWAECWICGRLAKLLLMKRANKPAKKQKRSLILKEVAYKNSNYSNGLSDSNGNRAANETASENLFKYEMSTIEDDELLNNNNKPNGLSQILRELQVITRKIKIDQEEEDKSLDWKFAAMVIDRLCMVFFSFATLISTAGILLTAKNFFKFT